MTTKFAFVAGALALGLAAPLTMGAGAAYAQCMHGERIDGSTAEQARSKIQRAGFSNVGDLRKGCDNFWHGTASQGGQRVGVVLSPAGEVHIQSMLDRPPGMSGGTSYIVPSDTQPAYGQPAYPQTVYPQTVYPQTASPAYGEPQPAVPVYSERERAVPAYPQAPPAVPAYGAPAYGEPQRAVPAYPRY